MVILVVFSIGFVCSNGGHAGRENGLELGQISDEVGRVLRSEALGQALVNQQ